MGRTQMPHHPLLQPELLCLHLWVGALFRFRLKKDVPGNGRPGPMRVSRPTSSSIVSSLQDSSLLLTVSSQTLYLFSELRSAHHPPFQHPSSASTWLLRPHPNMTSAAVSLSPSQSFQFSAASDPVGHINSAGGSSTGFWTLNPGVFLQPFWLSGL